MRAGLLDRRILIEAPSTAVDATYGTSTNVWTTVATVWASVNDVLMGKPGGSEHTAREVGMNVRPCRVLIRYRADVTTAMRITLLDRNRVMQITSVAEFGRREATELMCEEYSS